MDNELLVSVQHAAPWAAVRCFDDPLAAYTTVYVTCDTLQVTLMVCQYAHLQGTTRHVCGNVGGIVIDAHLRTNVEADLRHIFVAVHAMATTMINEVSSA